MLRAAWLTDIHLNFLAADGLERFAAAVRAEQPDFVWIGGDIAEGPSLAEQLTRFAELLDRPVQFVLGNHDFYFGSFATGEATARALDARVAALTYLPAAGVVALTERTGLIGHDGFADGGCGDFAGSKIRMSDYTLIAELKGLDPPALVAQMQARGALTAAHFHAHLPPALARFERVFVLTHNPPFREACKFQGQVTSDQWLPHLCNRQAGRALRAIAAQHPDRRITVLCGHTHHASEEWIAPNLEVITGAAAYRNPVVQRMFELA
ncbi:MAG: metallophosphoesterase family protein [Planctomycetota bacterium]